MSVRVIPEVHYFAGIRESSKGFKYLIKGFRRVSEGFQKQFKKLHEGEEPLRVYYKVFTYVLKHFWGFSVHFSCFTIEFHLV